MIQSVSLGVYKIELDQGEAHIIDGAGQVIAIIDLVADGAAEIALPDGQIVNVSHLIDVISSGRFNELTSAGMASSLQAATPLGSGMFFANSIELEAGDDRGGWRVLGNHSGLAKLLSGLGEIGTLGGFEELQVLGNDEPPAADPTAHLRDVAPDQPHKVTVRSGSGSSFDPHAPIALDESLTTNEDYSISRFVTATDPDGNPLSYSLLDGPRHGTVSFHADGTFTYVPVLHYHGADSFTYQASDGSHHSNAGTVSVLVAPANVAPVIATDEALTLPEDTVLAGSVIASDLNGDHLTYTMVTGPQHGSVTFHADGTFTYTPNASYSGVDNFTFQASDGSHVSNTGTVSLLITPVNQAPVASDEGLAAPENTVLTGTVTATDSNGDALTYSLVSGPAHGAIVFHADGTFTYTPSVNYHGSDSFTYRANDGSLNSNIGTVALTLTSVNQAPVASDENLVTGESTALTGTVTATDYNGDALSYSLVSGPAHGSVTLHADGSFTYVPSGGYYGADSFTYRASDGSLNSNAGLVSLLVTPANHAPIASDESLTTPEGSVLLGGVTASDPNGDHLTYSLVTAPQHGSVTLNSDGTFTYTPATNYHGADSFTYQASDGSLASNTSTVALLVTPINHAPVAYDQSVTLAEDNGLSGSVTASDLNGDPLTYALVSGPAHGTVSFHADGTFTYTPNANYNGADSFTYKANDGSLDSNAGTVSLTVTPVNDAPVASGAAVTTAEDTVLNSSVTVTDVDGDSLTYILVSGPAHGSVSLHADGTFTYTPAADYNGSDSFTYKANDGSLDSNVATINLTVTPVNDAPVAASATASTAEDNALNGAVTATDVENDPLSYRVITGPLHGNLTFNADGSYVYTPNANYNGSDSFTYMANDGSLDSNLGTVSLTVTPVNDAPVASNASATTAEDTLLTGNVAASDVDGDALSYSVVSGPAHGTLNFHADGSYTYTPATDYNGADSFTFKANDGSLNSNTGTVNLTVTAVNDAPTITVSSNTVTSHINDLSTTYNPLGTTMMGDYLRLQAGSKTFNYPTLANGVDPANIVLAQTASVTASYVATTGGYKSMIGTYVVDSAGNIDPTSVKFLWLNSTSVTQNQLDSPLVKDFLGNTQPSSISLGTIAAGSHIGTFMVSNGANQAANTTLLKGLAGVNIATDNYASDMAIINSKTSITFDGAGQGHITVNGTTLVGQTYFSTNPTWNDDYSTHGVQHMVAGAASNNDGALYIGLEDDYFNKNYDDNVIKLTFGDYNLSSITQATAQPVIHLADVDSTTMTAATIDTHGFQLGDTLHIPSSALFDVTATQSGNDYHVAITAHAGTANVSDLEAYLNTIFFSTKSSNETTRTMDYTVSDDQHASSSVVHGTVNVQSSWDVSASMLTASQTSLGSGDDHLRLNASLGHAVDMGAGNNTVSIETTNGSFGHTQASLLSDVQHIDTTGFGTNTVTLNITDVLHVTDGTLHLAVVGDAADSVILNNDGSGHHWQLTDTHGGSNFYTWSDPAHAAVVEISTLMHQTAN